MAEMTVLEKVWLDPEVLGAADPGTLSKGFFIPGEAVHVAPLSLRTVLDFTTPHGKASGILTGFMFWLGKFGYHVMKAYESLEISPVHAQYYQLTTQQKQQLERQIKEGLSSISSAVSDFELLFHDIRKYKDVLIYFDKIEKGKKEKNKNLETEGEQSLKAIFIDQVDVHTGEGVALKLIAPRWPTIIADFMKLEASDTDPKKIAEKLKVSEAEGVVLATKNKLYEQWKTLFKETVTGRYSRIMGLMKSRKKSIDEYRNMLKPYITRYRSIHELGSTEAGRRILEKTSWIGTKAQAISLELSTIWAFKAFLRPDIFKVAIEAFQESTPTVDIRKINFPSRFKEAINKNIDVIKEAGLDEGPLHPSGIEPLDKWVLIFIPHLEKHYGIKFTVNDILQTRKEFVDMCYEKKWFAPYYMTQDLDVERAIFRFPNGEEVENLMIRPYHNYMDTLNIILARFLEIKAQEKELEIYIAEMLGEKAEADVAGALKSMEELSQEEFPFAYGVTPKTKKEAAEKEAKKALKKMGLKISFIKPGPYELNFDDLITGPYFDEISAVAFKPAINFLKGAFDVPGFKATGAL